MSVTMMFIKLFRIDYVFEVAEVTVLLLEMGCVILGDLFLSPLFGSMNALELCVCFVIYFFCFCFEYASFDKMFAGWLAWCVCVYSSFSMHASGFVVLLCCVCVCGFYQVAFFFSMEVMIILSENTLMKHTFNVHIAHIFGLSTLET